MSIIGEYERYTEVEGIIGGVLKWPLIVKKDVEKGKVMLAVASIAVPVVIFGYPGVETPIMDIAVWYLMVWATVVAINYVEGTQK